ncbi:MAG: glyoxylase I family protein [Alteromonadaceae bacterium]|jgi:glyoxylase I family protein
MIEIIAIDHLVLRTTKLNDMLHFYCKVLGCKLERQTSKELGLTQLRAGSALIDLVDVNSQLGQLGGGPPSQGNNNLDHFCLQLKAISNVDIVSHLSSFEIELDDFSLRYGAQGFGDSLYIEDPEGNVIELKSQK